MVKIATYIITHVDSGKFYVGSTSNLNGRINQHKFLLKNNKHFNKNLQLMYNESNEINITIEAARTREDAYILEQKIIDENKDSNLLLNISLDARVSKIIFTDEIRKRYSEIQKNIFTEEIRQRLIKTNTGLKRTEEFKQNLSLARRGENNPMFGTISPTAKEIIIDDVKYKTQKEACIKLTISPATLSRRLHSDDPKFEKYIQL